MPRGQAFGGQAVDVDGGVFGVDLELDGQRGDGSSLGVLQALGEPKQGGTWAGLVEHSGRTARLGIEGQPAQHDDRAIAHAANLRRNHAVGTSRNTSAQGTVVLDEVAVEAGGNGFFDEPCGALDGLRIKAPSNNGFADTGVEAFLGAGQQAGRVGGQYRHRRQRRRRQNRREQEHQKPQRKPMSTRHVSARHARSTKCRTC